MLKIANIWMKIAGFYQLSNRDENSIFYNLFILALFTACFYHFLFLRYLNSSMTWFSSDILPPFLNLDDLNSCVIKEPITVVIKYLVPYIVNWIVTLYKFPASTIPYEHLVLDCNINAGKKELRNLLNKFTGKINLRGHTFMTSAHWN